MRFFLRLKHWQIFTFYILLSYFSTRDYGLPHPLDALLEVSSLLFIISWNLLLGFALISIKPKSMKINTMPAIMATILIVFLSIITITMTDGMYESMILNITFGIMMIISLFVIAAFPANALKSIELGRTAKPMEYGNYLFEFFILFIGVWLYQPRINKIHRMLISS